MKRKVFAMLNCVLAVLMVCTTLFSGCFGSASNTPQSYIIAYTDDEGTHQLTVTDGMPYSITSIPEKHGYTFAGLFDSESGGTQYVGANGSSVLPFTDGKNIVLYPQFKANEYTVVLDFGGAAATGSRQLTASYGSSLPELPQSPVLEHMEFTGWYTAQDGAGIKVADANGLIPVVSVVNENNFDLDGDSIYLYANFETAKYTVTCRFGNGVADETLKIPYNTPISQIGATTRVGGQGVLVWSETEGGDAFMGNVVRDMTLYAKEYAPVIELNVNGGKAIVPVIARAGSQVTLPVPEKELAKFLHWEDANGNEYTSTTMPEQSITLKAVWQAKIVFDENGGTNVEDISVASGERITLPTPTRDGYVFAGWYTADKKQYTSTQMPSAGVALKAGWYKTVCLQKTFYDSGALLVGSDGRALTIDLSEYNPQKLTMNINVSVAFSCQHYDQSASFDKYKDLYLGLYSENTKNDQFLLGTRKFYPHENVQSYRDYNDFKQSIQLTGNKLYVNFSITSSFIGAHVKNVKVDLEFSDATKLYL